MNENQNTLNQNLKSMGFIVLFTHYISTSLESEIL
jgi:hypothetical protein